MFAPRCSFSGCRRRTKDASGRCHDHQRRDYLAEAMKARGFETVEVSLPKGCRKVTDKRGDIGGSTDRYLDASGVLSRTDGPAMVEHHGAGHVSREFYYLRGAAHRVGAPADVGYYASGHPAHEGWYLSGELSRIDGPALSVYGPAATETWYLAGREVEGGSRGLVAAIEKTDPADVEEAFRASPLGPLLDEGFTPTEVARVIPDVTEAGVSTIEGFREVLNGAPVEWVANYEKSHVVPWV